MYPYFSRSEGIFKEYLIRIDWDEGGQFSALLYPVVDYVQIIDT